MKGKLLEMIAPYRRKRYVYPDPRVANYAVLSFDPSIFLVAHWLDEQCRFLHSMEMLFEALAERPAYILYNWYWNIDEPERVKLVKRFEMRQARRYPRHHFIHLCNTLQQYDVFREHGLNAVFCSQLCLVDENTYQPRPAIEKRFDAVYDARLKEYKRHFLASRIGSLALIHAFDPVIDDLAFVAATKKQLGHAHFFNEAGGSYRELSAAEVNDCLAACHVGLCLSRVEGAMYASVQYLLAGLPIVSTRSKGGREVFFDDEYVLIVDDDANAVREGVEEMVRRAIPPESIRGKTLARSRHHRSQLISVVQGIYHSEGVDREFAAEWNEVFFDKLVAPVRHEDMIRRLLDR